jgi:hypothetical protein
MGLTQMGDTHGATMEPHGTPVLDTGSKTAPVRIGCARAVEPAEWQFRSSQAFRPA